MSTEPTSSPSPSLAEIETALGIVQSTLDRLTARGHDGAAFDLARAQFSASLRSSWPGNLATLVGHLRRVASDAALTLSDEERHDVDRAIGILARVHHG